jgi:dipeptidase E
MKLYLASYRIPTPEDLFELAGRNPAETNVAIIPNAKDYRPEREQKLEELATDLGDLGLKQTTFVNLNDFHSPDQLHDELSKFDMVYVAGGNTTDLLFAVRTSGFHTIVTKLLNSGIVYVGESAGAIIAGPTIKGFMSENDPPGVVKHYETGLGLVDKVVIPHADNVIYNDRAPQLVEMYGANGTIVLNDNQAYIVDGNNEKIVAGE